MQRTKILSNITTHDHSDHDCRKSDPVPTFIYSLIKRSCPRHSSFHSSGSSALDPAIYEPCIQSTEKYIDLFSPPKQHRSEEHTSELQSRGHLVCRLLLEKKK